VAGRRQQVRLTSRMHKGNHQWRGTWGGGDSSQCDRQTCCHQLAGSTSVPSGPAASCSRLREALPGPAEADSSEGSGKAVKPSGPSMPFMNGPTNKTSFPHGSLLLHLPYS
jgi:hypothetical protein